MEECIGCLCAVCSGADCPHEVVRRYKYMRCVQCLMRSQWPVMGCPAFGVAVPVSVSAVQFGLPETISGQIRRLEDKLDMLCSALGAQKD